MILIKDKDRKEGEGNKANILLALGLVFWFIANIVWAYYELVLDIVSPVLPWRLFTVCIWIPHISINNGVLGGLVAHYQ